MDDRNNIWNNNNNQLPEGWGGSNLPDNWGNQSTGINSNDRPKTNSSNSNHNNNNPVDLNNFADKAKSGLGMLSGAAHKVGDAAKSAAGNAVDFAKSDEVKERINTVKNKANSLTEKVKNSENSSLSEIPEEENTYFDLDNTSSIDTLETSDDTVLAEQATDALENTYTPEPVISDNTDTVVLPESPTIEKQYAAQQPHEQPPIQQSNYTDKTQYTGSYNTPSQPYDTSYQTQNTPPPTQYQNYSPPPQNNYNAPPPVQQQSDFQRYQEPKKSNAIAILLAVIVILLLGIAVIGVLFLLKGRKTEPAIDSSVSAVVTTESNEDKTTTVAETEDTTTESDEKEATEESAADKKSSQIVAGLSKEEVYSKYLEVINGMEFIPPHRGFLTDLNSDGINEMIIPDVSDMTYKLYYCDGSSVKSHSFGGFMALDNFEMYNVDGDNGKKYVYYRDNYSYKSSQGYFSMDDMSEIDIFLNFSSAGSGTADWKISYNGTEKFAEGTDNVSKVYGETKNCYANILESFKKYGFGISDSSKYNSIEGLYYDDLVKKLGGNVSVATTKAAAPKAKIIASLVEEPALQGVTVYLVVTGDYSSYSYKKYEYDPGGSYSTNEGTSSAGKLEITAFSGGVSKVVVDVTPYNSDGIAGDTVSATYVPGSGGSSNNKTVTSCTKYGTIYSPSGNKVDGLTRSYLIDGGAATYERHDLTHGWHVTAVNQYFDGSSYWYELYDSDDGDYYGWVAAGNISFY